MSFSSVANKVQYATDGIVDTFSFPYPFQATDNLVVKLKDNTTLLVTTLVENTDYTVTPVGDAGRYTSGSVVTDSVLASGSTITITRIVANDQETANYNPGGDFDEQSTEDAFDKASMQAQQAFNDAVILKRTGDVSGPVELPDLADNAGKFLQISSGGNGITAADSAVTSDARVNSLFNGPAGDDIFATFINLVNGGLIIDGTGSPEGVVVAPVGSIFLRADGGTVTAVYYKASGTGNAGWIAIGDFVTDQGGGSALRRKIINIGDWDMSAGTGQANIAVAHGLTLSKIRPPVEVLIRDDTAAGSLPLNHGVNATDTTPQGFVLNITATNVNLYRLTGGDFDSSGFNSTSFNRGWITLWYTE